MYTYVAKEGKQEEKGRSKKKKLSPYLKLIQSANPPMVKEWSSRYSLTQSKKEFMKDSLIACLDC